MAAKTSCKSEYIVSYSSVSFQIAKHVPVVLVAKITGADGSEAVRVRLGIIEFPLNHRFSRWRVKNAKTAFASKSNYTWTPHFGETPMHLAALFCGTEMIQLLLAAGADPGVLDGATATPQDYLKRQRWIRCERDIKSMEMMLKAAGPA